MIRAVADTHTLVWALFDDPRLSRAARAAMEVSPGDSIAISAITLVELVYLCEKGRIGPEVFLRVLDKLHEPQASLVEVPVERGIVEAMKDVPRSDVPDLPDRLIAATAVSLGVPVLSRDRKIRTSRVPTVW
ncbi:MAG: type II toxin-antitoxin system VapC family toxin [Deferrisomatales bacterium]|nr:type II toxin-antitoxin system VapC family toxin [Deferrisomatales bacterium]